MNLRGWKSKWFATGQKYRDYLKNDILIREFLEKKLRGKYVASIEFVRDQKSTKIVIATSRPGFIIGKSGEGIATLTKEVIREMKRKNIVVAADFSIDVTEVKNPDSNAMIVAQQITEGLERRLPFRRVMKQMLDNIMQAREVKGAKISLGGRLGGNEMSRREEVKRGGIPLQFIRGDVDYAAYRANLPYGVIGVKVWIYKGDSLENKNNNR
ncbi:MAG: small subunit ribosomal protein S3 [Candidatus Paceibacteria bacterium]